MSSLVIQWCELAGRRVVYTQELVSSAGNSDDELCISSNSEMNVNITIGAENSPHQGSTKQSKQPCIQSSHIFLPSTHQQNLHQQ